MTRAEAIHLAEQYANDASNVHPDHPEHRSSYAAMSLAFSALAAVLPPEVIQL